MAFAARVAPVLLALAGAWALPAVAQDASVAKPDCKKPEYPGKLATETRMRAFNNENKTYGECIKKYVTEHQKLAEEHIKAANQAVTDYNAVVKDLQAEVDAAKD